MRALALAAALAVGCQGLPGATAPTGQAPGTTPASAGTPATTAASGSATAGTAPASTGAAAASRWRRIADIPTPRSEVAATRADQFHTFFVIGGFGGRDRVESYDDSTGRWERMPDLPIGVDHPMAATVTGLQSSAPQGVFVFGGYMAGPTARSFRFDLTARRWEEIAPMPAPRAAGAAVAVGDRIFIVGGADGPRLIAPTYEYNVSTRSWRTVAAIPTPRDHLSAVELDGRACAVGGRRLSMSQNVATFECYDPRTDRWDRLPDAPTARGGSGAAQYDRRVYFVGGEQPSGTFREVEIYDARTNAWTRGPDLPTARHGIGVVASPGTKSIDASRNLVTTPPRLLVLTGGPTPGGSQTAVCEALDLN